MTFVPPEDDDDVERMAITMAPVLADRIAKLLAIETTPKDLALIQGMARRDPKTLTPEHRHWVQQLLWKYRRALPPGTAPKLNPDDPIVRAMEEMGV